MNSHTPEPPEPVLFDLPPDPTPHPRQTQEVPLPQVVPLRGNTGGIQGHLFAHDVVTEASADFRYEEGHLDFFFGWPSGAKK